jgi:hypothetical protein
MRKVNDQLNQACTAANRGRGMDVRDVLSDKRLLQDLSREFELLKRTGGEWRAGPT